MSAAATLLLRNRSFRVSSAVVKRGIEAWFIEIETERVEYDGEWWAPCVYHQGLAIPAQSGEELSGVVVKWREPPEPRYQHPELPFMYVFGHHDVRHATLKFGRYENGHIEVEWNGICDVLWEGEFASDVPFSVRCRAQLHEG
jgi:hypothetical protein